jgi:PTH1 family peptidyl-tRNA hydrolase
MKLIVGLGNPGSKYARNRHNVGFMAVERIAERHGFGPWRKKFSGLAAAGEIGGHKVLLLKPETYMNDSGRAVAEAMHFHKLGEDDVLVVHDEIDLAPAKLKIKSGGGNAGHNGLRSITSHIGNDYGRVRIGVGHPGSKELVHGWVLRDFSKADAEWLEPLLDAITEAAGRLAAGDQARFLTDVARKLQQADKRDDVDAKSAAAPAPEIKRLAPHPAGERQSKRQSALAANLKRWLAGQKKPG